MKKIFLSLVLTIFIICLSVASVGADIPNLIRFQGKVTDSVGAPLNKGGQVLKYKFLNRRRFS